MKRRWYAIVGLAGCALLAGCTSKPRTEPCACADSAGPSTAGPSATATSSTGLAAIPWDFPRASDMPPPLPASVELPSGGTAEVIHTMLVVDVSKDGTLAVDGRPVGDTQEVIRLATAAHQKDPDARAVIRADRAVSWGAIIGLLDRLRGAGFSKIAFGVSALPAQ
jgi:biopolymer transport protein ExbD